LTRFSETRCRPFIDMQF